MSHPSQRRFPLVLAWSALIGGLCAFGHAPSADATTTFVGPTPYLSADDSLLLDAVIEDLTDGLLNTPGIGVSAGVPAGPCGVCDSVDADDGAIDGSGNVGGSWYSDGETSLTFTFDAATLGSLPTAAGLVWTDVGSGGGFIAPFTFEAFGPGGESLGSIGPFDLGDLSDTGVTAEDRFFGVSNTEGVSAIRIGTNNGDWEVDHVQYGTGLVPEPSTFVLLALGSAALAVRRRRP